jgi:ABC-type sugar transport system substrate-binding protein
MGKQAKALGIPYTETGPTSGTIDVTTMVEQIKLGIADKYGAITTFPATNGFTGVISQARKAGIIFATLYGGAGTETGANVNIGADFAESGAIYEHAVAARPGPLYVGMMVQAPAGAGLAWENGFKAAAKNDKNIHIVGVVYTNDDASVAYADASALLTAHTQINVVVSHMGTVTAGLSAAIKVKHLIGKVVGFTNGTPTGGIAGLLDGTIAAVQMQSECGMGKQVSNAVEAIAAGQKVPFQIKIGLTMATKNNYKHYLALGWA